MNSNEIRTKWITFFVGKNHLKLEPVNLIPVNDDSLLWINSGVATLKPYFEGKKTPPSKRMVNFQKSIRTNDIENVGQTSRHHTFFEMLGNFSIGDYFKQEAIEMAWEFLTFEKWLNIDKKLIYITYFSKDEETKKIWLKLGINPEHLIPMGESTNFWEVGKGPCGPSTEIFVDRGSKFSSKGKELISKDIENDRFIEIWNIVFSEFNCVTKSERNPLPKKNIDTGAGLERIASILQKTTTNFETDLFFPIIKTIEKFTDKKYNENYYFDINNSENNNKSFQIIADHMRTIVFAIGDGQVPHNQGRGYVIKRLIRRMVVESKESLNIKINKDFIEQIVNSVIVIMEIHYPELRKESLLIKKIVFEEAEKFLVILTKAEKEIKKFKKLDSEKAFLLFESHGIPLSLIKSISKKLGHELNEKDFNKKMIEHQNLARENQKKTLAIETQDENIILYDSLSDEFIGYDKESISTEIIATVCGNKENIELKKEGVIILKRTPFYATSGGQVNDFGIIATSDGKNKFQVTNVIKHANDLHIHQGIVIEGKFNKGDKVEAKIDKNKRQRTNINHSSTHIAFYHLEKILNSDLPQMGAFYDDNKFRFDFKYSGKFDLVNTKEKLEIEVNKTIKQNLIQRTDISTLEIAKNNGAKFIEGETYGDIVRVVRFGKDIIDLCGGTHVKNTKEIKEVVITKMEIKGSNVYRVDGLTSKEEINKWTKNELSKIRNEFNLLIEKYKKIEQENNALDKIIKKFDEETKPKNSWILFKEFQSTLKTFELKQNDIKVTNIIKQTNLKSSITKIADTEIFRVKVEDIDMKIMKHIFAQIINNIENKILVLESKDGENINFIIGVSKTSEINLRKNFEIVQKEFFVKGGGGPKMLQGNVKNKVVEEFLLKFLKGIK